MKDAIKFSATVVKPDGTLFYKGEHEWSGVPQVQIDWFTKELTKAYNHLLDLSKEPKEDAGNYAVTLKATVGDVTYPDTVLNGITYNVIVKQERYWNKLSADLCKIGEDIARNKAKAYKKA